MESNGTSDPFARIYPDAKKREIDTRLITSHIQGTIAPVVRPYCFYPPSSVRLTIFLLVER